MAAAFALLAALVLSWFIVGPLFSVEAHQSDLRNAGSEPNEAGGSHDE